MSLIHRVDFGHNIEKNPGPSVYVDATKTIHALYCQGNVVVLGKCWITMCFNEFGHFNLQQGKKDIRLLRSVDDMIQIMTALTNDILICHCLQDSLC